jgi:hypothetical protein
MSPFMIIAKLTNTTPNNYELITRTNYPMRLTQLQWKHIAEKKNEKQRGIKNRTHRASSRTPKDSCFYFYSSTQEEREDAERGRRTGEI